MRYIRYACIAIFAVALILVAMANREFVTLRVVPEDLERFVVLTPQYDVPLFAVIFAAVLAGLILGFLWEFIREAGERAQASRQARELAKLKREVKRLKGEAARGDGDEVLALLGETS